MSHSAPVCTTCWQRSDKLQCLQTVLEGFNNTDPYLLVFPDDLHQSMKGDQEHLLDIIGEKFTPIDRGLVNEAILSLPPFPGLRLPSQGLTTTTCYGTQRAAMFKVAPVALLAVQATVAAVDLAKRLATTFCGEIVGLRLAGHLLRLMHMRCRHLTLMLCLAVQGAALQVSELCMHMYHAQQHAQASRS